jgi:hypothetical protein
VPVCPAEIRLLEGQVTFLCDGRGLVPLRLRGHGWQASKVRCAIRTLPNQDRRAAKDYGWALCAGPEQHRQNTEKCIVADDDVDLDVAQDLLQRLVLRRNRVDEGAREDDATADQPRRVLR